MTAKFKPSHLSPIFLISLAMSCSGTGADFISSYSSSPSLAILEGLTWQRVSASSSSYNASVVISNLYYGTTYKGTVERIVYYDFVSIEVSMGLRLERLHHELAKYSVDVEQYSSLEYSLLRDNARRANASDFKLWYTFDLKELLFTGEEAKGVAYDIYFLVNYTERQGGGTERVFGRIFTATVAISWGRFALSCIDFDWV